jgi:hypothetical protein
VVIEASLRIEFFSMIFWGVGFNKLSGLYSYDGAAENRIFIILTVIILFIHR